MERGSQPELESFETERRPDDVEELNRLELRATTLTERLKVLQETADFELLPDISVEAEALEVFVAHLPLLDEEAQPSSAEKQEAYRSADRRLDRIEENIVRFERQAAETGLAKAA